jgi:ribonuclease Z
MDHRVFAGGIFNLWDSMGWARNTPLHVWGASGSTPELGVASFVDHVTKSARGNFEPVVDCTHGFCF